MSEQDEYVYLVTHVDGDVENLTEDDYIGDFEGHKIIGIFSDTIRAEAAIARLRSAPGFSRYPKGFIIDPYAIDETDWETGFFNPSDDEF